MKEEETPGERIVWFGPGLRRVWLLATAAAAGALLSF
jgi:hypothetical protein